MQPIQFFAARAEDGALLPDATVDVFAHGTQDRAVLFSDSAGTVPLENPLRADANARVFFYSTTNRIDIRISRYGYVAPMLLDISTVDVATAVEQVRAEIDQVLEEARVDFENFLRNSGFETPVDYVVGLSITRPTQTVRFNGELYRAKDTSLPFTTTTWAADATKFLAIGDAALRQELADTADPNKNANLIGMKRTVEPNALAFRISKYHTNRALNLVTDFGLVMSGAADQTARLNTIASDLAGIAAANGGKCPLAIIPYGDLRLDGTVNLYPFFRFKSEGPLQIYAGDNNGIVFRVRNDLLFSQGTEADFNIGSIFDGENGGIKLFGNDTAGSVAFSIGNDVGTPVTGKYSAFCGLNKMHIRNFDRHIFFTNNNVFAGRFNDLKLSNANVAAISNASDAPVNSGELHEFRGCFINNCERGIETNSEIEIKYSGSISFTKRPIRLNGDHLINLHLDLVHFEKFGTDADDALIFSTATNNLLLPSVNFSGYILPSHYKGFGPGGNVPRTIFKGKMNLNFGPTNVHSDNFGIEGTNYQFLCNPDVIVRGQDNVKAGGSISINVGSMSFVPDPQVVNVSAGVPVKYTSVASPSTLLSALSAGTPARTTLKVTSAGGQRGFLSEMFPVMPGQPMFSSCLADVQATVAGAKVNMRFNWFYQDKSSAGTSSFLSSDLTSRIGQPGWNHAYLGTGRQIVPAGAMYAQLEIRTDVTFSGDMLLTSFMSGNA
jgi:hypothetical protein